MSLTRSSTRSARITAESQALEALNKHLTALVESPLDLDLHVKHIELAHATKDEIVIQSARELLADNLAATADVWLPWIQQKMDSLDVEKPEEVMDLMALFLRAEQDYLCAWLTPSHSQASPHSPSAIPILQKHLEFLTETHDKYASGAPKPAELEQEFTAEWTRVMIEHVLGPGLAHPHRVRV